ncbi:MAG: hypothetical protein ACRCVT_16015 [Leadbetterella sp.]
MQKKSKGDNRKTCNRVGINQFILFFMKSNKKFLLSSLAVLFISFAAWAHCTMTVEETITIDGESHTFEASGIGATCDIALSRANSLLQDMECEYYLVNE